MHELSIATAVLNTAGKHADGPAGEGGQPARRRPAPGGAGLAAVLLRDRGAGHGVRGFALGAGARSSWRCSAANATREWSPELPVFRCPECGSAERHDRGRRRARGGATSKSRNRRRMHRTKVRIVEDALDANNTIARANRDDFDRHGVSVVNLMSAPGAGKTTLLERALAEPLGDVRVGVLEGDVAGLLRRRPARGPARAGDAAQHRSGLRRRVPSRREHGPLGAAGAAAATTSTCS